MEPKWHGISPIKAGSSPAIRLPTARSSPFTSPASVALQTLTDALFCRDEFDRSSEGSVHPVRWLAHGLSMCSVGHPIWPDDVARLYWEMRLTGAAAQAGGSGG